MRPLGNPLKVDTHRQAVRDRISDEVLFGLRLNWRQYIGHLSRSFHTTIPILARAIEASQ